MPETRPIPVRIGDELIARLDACARKIGSKRSQIIGICIRTFVAEFERHGEALLPPNWKDLLNALDGRRTTESHRVAGVYPAQTPSALELNEDQTSAPPPKPRKRKGKKPGGQP